MPYQRTYRPPGRPPGRLNNRTLARNQEVDAAVAKYAKDLGIDLSAAPRDPKFVLEGAMAIEWAKGNIAGAAALARDLMPYHYPQLRAASVVVQQAPSGTEHLSDAELECQLARLRALAAGSQPLRVIEGGNRVVDADTGE